MGLTEAKLKDLQDRDFHKLYDDHITVWKAAHENAKQYVTKTITQSASYRPDDLLEPLIPAVRANQLFRDHQENNSAKSPRFVTAFAEYIIDKNPPPKEGK